MIRTLNSIRKIGTYGVSSSQRKIILMVNTISIITAMLALSVGSFLFILTGKAAIGVAAYVEVALFSTIIAMNHLKKYGTARIATHLVQNATILYFGVLFGAHVDVKLMAVFLGIIPLLLFTDRHVKITCLVITCVTIFILECNYQYDLFDPMYLSTRDVHITRWVSLAVIMFLVIVVVWFSEEDKRKANQSLADANQQLELLADQLQQAVAYKAKYVQQVTHEIRGPFNAIFQIAQMLLSKTSKQDKFKDIESDVQILSAGCYQSLSIINSALDVSKLEHGIYPLKIDIIDVKSWIEEIAAIFRYIASLKNVSLQVIIRPEAPLSVQGDQEKLTRIVNNLVTNAIKFTREDSTVTITVDGQGSFWGISVADRGNGMNQIELDDAFQIYKTSSTDSATGVGLGLYFVNQTIDMLKGTIKVVTQKGKGTNFIISFPLIMTNAPQANQVRETVSIPVDITGKRILVVDDDAAQTTFACKYLQGIGATVRTCGTAKQGLEILGSWTPDLVLLDHSLPDMSGLEVLEELKSDPMRSFIPVVLLTGDNHISREQVIAAGGFDYILKPYKFSELHTVLDRCFQEAASYKH